MVDFIIRISDIGFIEFQIFMVLLLSRAYIDQELNCTPCRSPVILLRDVMHCRLELHCSLLLRSFA
jgi:hypothetical protein